MLKKCRRWTKKWTKRDRQQKRLYHAFNRGKILSEMQKRFGPALYFLDRPFGVGGGTDGSESPKFSAAHFRANSLSSAALCRLSLCLIFSQWVSMVFLLRRNWSAISRALYEAPRS